MSQNYETPRMDAIAAKGRRGMGRTAAILEVGRELERELAEVCECTLSNCNKLNRARDKMRELSRDRAALRAELQAVADWYRALPEPGLVPAGLNVRAIAALLAKVQP